jgi:alkaline phosphatase
MDTSGRPLTTIFEVLARQGKSIGAVTSVQISHATPAAVYGHNVSRNNYAELAKEAVHGSFPAENNAWYDAGNYHGNLKVIMGAGHPEYDNSGVHGGTDDPLLADKFVGGETAWNALQTGTNGWTLIDAKEDFEALAGGGPVPDKVFGVARVNETLQQKRAAGQTPNENVPTLQTMTRAAFNVLGANPGGFAVMIEGGAVDWANHANQLDRMIEEQIDFNRSVQVVVDWVEANSSWDETLLIVTSDHDCGYLWGDGTSDRFFDVDGDGVFTSGTDYGYLTDHGVGNLPGAQFFSGSHTNALVPLYAKGAGSEWFLDHVIGTDPNLAGYYDLDPTVWTGQFIDNTAVFRVMSDAAAVPEPAPAPLLGAGAAGTVLLNGRRRVRSAPSP